MTPQVDIFGLVIREPTTTLTDYLVATTAFWFALQLIVGASHRRNLDRCLWGIGFAFIGLGAVLGGTSHGFAGYLSETVINRIWKFTLYSIGLSMAFAVAGTIRPSVRQRRWQWLLHGINISGLVVYVLTVFGDNSYLNAIVMTVSSLLAIVLLQGYAWLIKRTPSTKWITSGVVVSFMAAAVQRSNLELHAHFNHNDLYHLVQLVGIFLLYKGATLLCPYDSNV